jgi:hypothetical protein
MAGACPARKARRATTSEGAVRAAARSIEERLGHYPDPDELVHDDEFLRASTQLADAAVPVEIVEQLTRSSTPTVAAAADRALSRRGDVRESSVRTNPFSVVLLDEFEKAHRRIWDVFLPVFDDGRLTDDRGRTADFRQCVVILTSNLGAAVERGSRPDSSRRSARNSGRPRSSEPWRRSFGPNWNRIDRVVVFRPFEREQMRVLLQRELTQVRSRRGFRSRPWAVEWDESALELLGEKGFSPELGARPLKRASSGTCSRRSRQRSSTGRSRKASSSCSSPHATVGST